MDNISVNLPLFDRDLSWLSFNYRVLCMANDSTVPLYERIKFLSIFSSNLDEFFRVRMPAVLAVDHLLRTDPSAAGTAERMLPAVQEEISRQLGEFGQTLTQSLLPALHNNHIHLYYNEPIHEAHKADIREFFLT